MRREVTLLRVVGDMCEERSRCAWEQWRSQDTADARAQHGHIPFVRTSN